jgi:hypothetical protein
MDDEIKPVGGPGGAPEARAGAASPRQPSRGPSARSGARGRRQGHSRTLPGLWRAAAGGSAPRMRAAHVRATRAPPHTAPRPRPISARAQVFCGNFEYDASERDVQRLFERFGPVERIDMKTGERPAGSGAQRGAGSPNCPGPLVCAHAPRAAAAQAARLGARLPGGGARRTPSRPLPTPRQSADAAAPGPTPSVWRAGGRCARVGRARAPSFPTPLPLPTAPPTTWHPA